MTNLEKLKQNIYKTAMLTVSGSPLKFKVIIIDVRSRYGHFDYLVQPVTGDGESWHSVNNLLVLDNNPKA